MADQLPKPIPSPDADGSTTYFSVREKKLLAEVEESGVRPISPTLAIQFFEVFLEGYSCARIAKLNPPFREADILFLRKKYLWDDERDQYAQNLHLQMRDKLIKQRLESLEFLTNQLAVAHKALNSKMLKYLQTGKEDDLPDSWITGPTAYKGVLEAIQKLTGEDRVTTQNINSESKITVDSNVPINVISEELQSKVLKRLATKSEEKKK